VQKGLGTITNPKQGWTSRRPAVELFAGDVAQSDGTALSLCQLVDRRSEPPTERLIQRVEEPLSPHRGHGDARPSPCRCHEGQLIDGTMTTLFDDFERTDSRVARQQESQFDFYNRVATRGWSTVRDEVERWFGLYCDDAEPQKANDLRGETPRGARREQHRTP
jgi:hypothetical protein